MNQELKELIEKTKKMDPMDIFDVLVPYFEEKEKEAAE